MTKNHNAKSCNQQLVCRLYGELHPTGMHDYIKKKTNEDHDTQPGKSRMCCSDGKLEIEVICMYIVAILVGHKSSRKMVKTHEMLDNCSQGSFIKEEIIEELGITGRN